MSQQLVKVLENDGYDNGTAVEIVKLAEEKPDDVASEFLEEIIDDKAAITRYIRSRNRPKPLSQTRQEPAKKPQPKRLSPALLKTSSPGSSTRKPANPSQPYARPIIQPGSSIHKQIVSEKSTPASKSDKEFTTQMKIDSIKDLDAAIKKLELDDPTRRPCNCMGSRHGLCEMAPNCLNCGRIVCGKEGLGKCFGCSESLIDNVTLAEVFGVLQEERNTIISTMGKRALKSANIDPSSNDSIKENFSKANSNLARLLSYQNSSAVRTKIIDHAADFDTPDMGTNMWASPLEQARQLKEQQRRQRRSEEVRKSRRGQGRKLISIDIRGNKVYQKAEDVYDDSTSEEEEEPEEVEKVEEKQASAFFDVSKYGTKFVKPVYNGSNSPASIASGIVDEKVARDDNEVLAW
ncbi:Uncharacterized protein C1A6.01c [Wickerhamiella sorbophila]|uniref:Uncharacterized protein C1A6.01c n=1 Tax=Wickerhamiella sorbophila TaxID=45607 RepID=A0A2T0FF79_9ASCO|nr:Uncharacterized protein C1A6.01c [Wickerhamiella sorbophila]PRT53652.1 Uncharacterized protein C1A6.01c [Wickerhamiella sorbophila]